MREDEGEGYFPLLGRLRGGAGKCKSGAETHFLSRHMWPVASRPALFTHGSEVILVSLKPDPRFLSLEVQLSH